MQNSDWSEFLYAACLIAVIFFVVGTIMLVLYIIRVICTSASLTTRDIESSARSKSAKIEARSEREQSLKSARSLSTGKSGSRRSRRSKTRPSQRSTSRSQSEREEEPGSRRSTSLRSTPIKSAEESEGQTLNVVLKRKDVKFSKFERSSQEDEAFSEKKTQIKGVDIPKQTLKAGTHEAPMALDILDLLDSLNPFHPLHDWSNYSLIRLTKWMKRIKQIKYDEVISKTKGPVGIDIPRVIIRAGDVDDAEKDEISPKGVKGVDIPRKILRSGAAGERQVTKPKAAPSITFNVEPGASISVNVLSGRARAGGGENEKFAMSHTSRGTDTIDAAESTASATLTKI